MTECFLRWLQIDEQWGNPKALINKWYYGAFLADILHAQSNSGSKKFYNRSS